MDSRTLLNLDLKQSSTMQVVRAKRGDTARSLEIRLRSGIEPWPVDPSYQAVMTGKKADGTSLYNDCEIREGKVLYKFTEQTTSCAGEVNMELRIYSGQDQLITTAMFVLEVYDTEFTAQDAAKSADEQTALNALVNKTLDAKNATEALTEEIRGKLDRGELIGESAYEEAVRLGYKGTEEEWLNSLRYDHSEEFTALAQQVEQNTETASQAASTASSAAEAAAGAASSAGSSAEAAQTAQTAAADSAGAAAGSAASAEVQARQAETAAGSALELQKKTADSETSAAGSAKQAGESAAEAKNQADRATEAAENAGRGYTNQVAANALVRTVQGEIIALDDVSLLEHSVGCKVERINLFDGKTTPGVYLNTDGTTVANISYSVTGFIPVAENASYIFNTDVGSSRGKYYDSNKKAITSRLDFVANASIKAPTGCAFIRFTILTANITDKMQLEKGSVSTPYAPYIPDLSKVTVSRYGGNIAPHPEIGEYLGVGFVLTEKGYTFAGTAPRYYDKPIGEIYLPAGTYSVRTEGPDDVMGLTVTTATGKVNCRGNTQKPVILDKAQTVSLSITSGNDFETDLTGIFLNYQLSKIDIGYIEKLSDPVTYAPGSDGVVSGIKSIPGNMTILADTPGALIEATYNQNSIAVVKKQNDRIAALENLITEKLGRM